MTSSKLIQARREFENARAVLVAAEQEEADKILLKLASLGDDSVVAFKLRLPGQTKIYSFAAVRANGSWFTTGSTCPRNGYTDDGLFRFIQGASSHDGVKVVRRIPRVPLPSFS